MMQAARMAERWYEKLSAVLDHTVRSPAADHPLRQPRPFRADVDHAGPARRRDRRVHRSSGRPRRAAVRRGARRNQPRARPRARARVSARHLRKSGSSLRDDAAVVCRRHGRVLLGRPHRSQHRDVAARRGERRPSSAARGSEQRAVVPVSLRPGALGVPRREVRRVDRRARDESARQRQRDRSAVRGDRGESRRSVARLARSDDPARGRHDPRRNDAHRSCDRVLGAQRRPAECRARA